MSLEDTPVYQQYLEAKATAEEVRAYSSFYCTVTIQQLLDDMMSGLDDLWNLIKKYATDIYDSILSAQQCIHKTVVDPKKITDLQQKALQKAHDMTQHSSTYDEINKALHTSLDKFKDGKDGCDDISNAYKALQDGLKKIQSLIDSVINGLEALAQDVNNALAKASSVINCIEDAVFTPDVMNTLEQVDPHKYTFVADILKAKQEADNVTQAISNTQSIINNYTSATSRVEGMINNLTTLNI